MKQNLLKNFSKIYFFIFLITIVFISFQITERNSFFIPEAKAGASDDVSGWAWSEKIGWISFNCDNPELPAPRCGIDYGLNIDDGTGEFSGYAWSEQIGWISFNKGELAGCPSGNCEAKIEPDNTLSGWARACLVFASGCSGALKPDNERGGWDGWIKLNGTATGPPPEGYGVFLDNTTSPYELKGWAWGADVIGWLSFNHSNCDTNGDGFSNGIGSCPSAGTPISVYKVIVDYAANQPQKITSVSDSPDPSEGGVGATFNSVASDPDSGDTIKLYICQDVLCANCEPGDTLGCVQDTVGAVVSDTAVVADPLASYTSSDCQHTDAQDYWAKACDQLDNCSNIISGGDFTVRKKDNCACGCANGICDECFGGYCCFGQCQSANCSGAYAEDLELGIVDYCIGSPGQGFIEFKWIYQNFDGPIQQEQFHIQISADASFTDPVIVDEYVSQELNPGETGTSGELIKVGGSDILYNDDYYWRIQVKATVGGWSGWALYDDAADPDGDGNSQTFTTPIHPYPYPNFTFTPENPGIDEDIQLCSTDDTPCLIRESICYSGAGEISCHTGDTSFLWDIPEIPANGSYIDGDAASYNPKIQFHAFLKTFIILEITDNSITASSGNCSDGRAGCCAITKNISSTLPFPEWREISPSD
jgi:hypothetical protein